MINQHLSTGLGSGLIDTGTIALDPAFPAIVYAGTGEAVPTPTGRYGSGILKSTDGGENWYLLATGSKTNPTAFFRMHISKIIVDPTNPQRLFAAVTPDGDNPDGDVNSGIYRSVDGGDSWELITQGLLNDRKIGAGTKFVSINVTDMDYTVDRTTGQFILYAGVVSNEKVGDDEIGGLWRSTTNGDSWQHIGVTMKGGGTVGNVDPSLDPRKVGRIELAADRGLRNPNNPLLYAVVAKLDETLMGVYSTVNGLKWERIETKGLRKNNLVNFS